MRTYDPRWRWLNNISPTRLIILFYLAAVVISTCLLALPVAHKEGTDISFVDVVFTAVSSISVTGLASVPIHEYFNTTGIIFIAFTMQLGGIGVMTLGTFVWLLFGKKIGFKERRLIMVDQNQVSFRGAVNLMRQILIVVLSIELIGFLVLGTYYLQYFPTAGEAYFQGLFASISATTNGGFDITGQSLIPFRHDYFVQFVHMLLIILGAIGFPVLIEVKQYIFASKDERTFIRFSLFAKLTTITFMVLIFAGAIIIALLDSRNFFVGKSWHEVLFYSLFQSVTTRSGGLATMDIAQLTEQNQLFMSALMFVGASPSSAGGGIRTTTLALVVIALYHFARGNKQITVLRREIHPEDLFKAINVTIFGMILVFTSAVILVSIEPFSLTEILFEVCSAFGTVGLSLGITPELSDASKVVLMLLMFLGRVGILTFLYSLQRNSQTANFHYPKERIIIG
ncbi:TrkH family potassium uptake protein [Terribacillus saccharophilus]|uniref:Ktr system potassium uptake protein D n=1 Tax=Terribacillus saccharophilus TaxID=361277 RepID=A0A268A9X9_9BACI|nr:TrkH family potassium uptake protein [Terribacillus saccharophilus]PAD20933.1 Ktr system potassium uptake protein D [Terribacillus saccharophilus]PAF16788.1 Ktr system potassium uptake protein D [Terribacillus saccharophilus]PAF21993.1 Ktr system potassium uptake protein D [Terribacillus saccharophilus]PAF34732.1 Ktr system potassium uptake protein D [Terribacillus saccharophilus]